MAKSFFDFFPTPKFLEMPAPGLALNDSGLKFIELGSGPGGQIVKRYGKAELPQGLIEAGNIKDQEGLTRALEDFRKSFDLRYIRASLPEERAYLFQTTVPNIGDRELRTAVEATIEENVPLSVSEVIFDYSVLPKQEGEAEDKVTVFVSVIPESIVLDYLSVFRNAGFMPLHFDVESQAVAKSLIVKNDPVVSLIVNLNHRNAGLYIVSQGAVSFTSTIQVDPPEKLSKNKTETSLNKEAVINDDLGLLKVYPALNGLVSEIKKVFLYWQTQSDRVNRKIQPIEKIILCGDESGRTGVSHFLAHELDTKVELGNVWKNVFSFDSYIPDISFEDSLSYAAAVGLALSRHKETQ
jgi:Tfp pilus assembly PilM family ATPase